MHSASRIPEKMCCLLGPKVHELFVSWGHWELVIWEFFGGGRKVELESNSMTTFLQLYYIYIYLSGSISCLSHSRVLGKREEGTGREWEFVPLTSKISSYNKMQPAFPQINSILNDDNPSRWKISLPILQVIYCRKQNS